MKNSILSKLNKDVIYCVLNNDPFFEILPEPKKKKNIDKLQKEVSEDSISYSATGQFDLEELVNEVWKQK